jgi:hypothetical protein
VKRFYTLFTCVTAGDKYEVAVRGNTKSEMDDFSKFMVLQAHES